MPNSKSPPTHNKRIEKTDLLMHDIANHLTVLFLNLENVSGLLPPEVYASMVASVQGIRECIQSSSKDFDEQRS